MLKWFSLIISYPCITITTDLPLTRQLSCTSYHKLSSWRTKRGSDFKNSYISELNRTKLQGCAEYLPGLHSCATKLRTSTAAGHCWMNSSQNELSSNSWAITRHALNGKTVCLKYYKKSTIHVKTTLNSVKSGLFLKDDRMFIIIIFLILMDSYPLELLVTALVCFLAFTCIKHLLSILPVLQRTLQFWCSFWEHPSTKCT